MRFRLDEVRQWPVTWEEAVTVDVAVLRDLGVTRVAPVAVAGDVRPTEAGELILRMNLSFDVTAACVRCLEPVATSHRVESVLLVVQKGPGQAERERDDDDQTVHVVGDELDTAPLIIEQVMLNLPMRFVCGPGCEGPLGAAARSPGEAPADTRWAPLAALKDFRN